MKKHSRTARPYRRRQKSMYPLYKAKRHSRKKAVLIVLAVLAAALIAWTVFTNVTVGTTHYTVQYDSLPQGLDGFKIAHISDFHNADMWGFGDAVVNIVRKSSPDIIAITGDLVDSKNTKVGVSLELVQKLSEIAPCYYVTGNHEGYITAEQRSELFRGMEKCGVTVLQDESVVISHNGADIRIAGIHDPCLSYGIDNIPAAVGEDEVFTVLLSHRPEHYADYKAAGVQLALSGHAHGGQIRLPFIGGLYAPHQGVLPKYDAGIYQDGDYALCVSRGIGNSVFPIRFYNQPEVVIIGLSRK